MFINIDVFKYVFPCKLAWRDVLFFKKHSIFGSLSSRCARHPLFNRPSIMQSIGIAT